MIMKCQKRLLNNLSTSSSIQMEWTSILYSVLSFRQKKSDEMMKINYHKHSYIRQSDFNGHRQINWLFKSCEKQRKDSFKLIVTKLYMNACLSLFFLFVCALATVHISNSRLNKRYKYIYNFYYHLSVFNLKRIFYYKQVVVLNK